METAHFRRRRELGIGSAGHADRREVSMRLPRTVVIFATLFVGAAMFAACGDDDDSDTESAATQTSTTEATTAAQSDEAGALAGTWRTKPLAISDMTKTLRRHGLQKWLAGFAKNAPISDASTVLILEVGDGRWDLYRQEQGGTREPLDFDAQLEVDGDTATASHEGDSNTYVWSASGDVLELTWLETTYPPHKGIPEEVFQRALYETADFRRTP
jgi:hypothetical protein